MINRVSVLYNGDHEKLQRQTGSVKKGSRKIATGEHIVGYFTGRLYECSSLAREELSILATPLLCPLIQRAADVVLAIGRSGENGSAMNGPIRISRE
jgi:hypothetical protein